ncbi:hypothetical protein [Methylobacterium bullatum]|uniref:Uncharacterized protein n=1 Tax=Methylobacterium bullatum TaxID=570505 RepID=A0AAV4Z230_9HYPH|nr:hypothetical protein [Methylobacterium bullatum]MBD8904179.1 hypothetical protein [Methylobacterium bullatum]GJD37738.1 hypothetical protein OICFNHDK_0176 [Methylobacterium bullatum]
MTDSKDGSQDRKDTKAAKAAERADLAGQVWEEVKVRETARDDQIVRLKAQRLERDAVDAAAIATDAASKGSRNTKRGG